MDWLTELIGLIEKVPPTFWGVVVGSFFSLGGVALTNRANTNRLRLQFVHDREVRVKDHDLALRKEVYLAAVEAISAGLMSVSKCSDLNIPDAEITKAYTDKAPAIAKVQIIATEETAKAVSDVSTELNATLLKLFTERVPLNAQKAQLSQLDDQIARFAKTRDEALDLMRQYNLAGTNDQRRWQVIQDNFKFEATRISDALQQKAAIGAALIEGQIKIAKQSVEEIQKLTFITLPAIFAVRKELDLPINESSYAEMVRERSERQKADLDQFLERLKTFAAAQSNTAVETTKTPADSTKPRTV